MATTSPDGISYPTNADAQKTIEQRFQDTADSVQTAITDVRGDVNTLLSGKADTSHTHAASAITSGTLSHTLLPAGTVVGFNYMRTNSITSYGYSQTPVVMSALNVSITPKYSNSLLLVQWMLTYEADYNSVFRIYRDGSQVGQSGYEGYNPTVSGYWNGYAPIAYDADRASTPNVHMIQYAIPANNTNATTLQLAVMVSAASGSGAFALNRAWNGNADAYEAGTSNASIWEIKQ